MKWIVEAGSAATRSDFVDQRKTAAYFARSIRRNEFRTPDQPQPQQEIPG